MNICIRRAKIIDSVKWATMLQELDSEVPYTIFEVGERSQDINKYEDKITSVLRNSRSAIFLAFNEEQDNCVIGYLIIDAYNYRRKAHLATVGIGVLSSYWSKGIASRFAKVFFEHVKKYELKRIEAHIATSNIRSIKLASKFGFKVESIKYKSLCINGKYQDEYMMVWDGMGDE